MNAVQNTNRFSPLVWGLVGLYWMEAEGGSESSESKPFPCVSTGSVLEPINNMIYQFVLWRELKSHVTNCKIL